MSELAKVAKIRGKNGNETYIEWLNKQTSDQFLVLRVYPDPRGIYSRPACSLSDCKRVSLDKSGFCRSHAIKFRAAGSDLQAFGRSLVTLRQVGVRAHGGMSAQGIFDLSMCESPIVRAELQFAISRKATGEFGGPLRVEPFNAFIRALNDAKVQSVRDLVRDDPRRIAIERNAGSYESTFRTYMSEFKNWIDLAEGNLSVRRRLGTRRGGSQRWSQSQDISRPWLREIVERWVAYRRNTEAGTAQHVGQQEAHVVEFALWAEPRGVSGPLAITRTLLLDWLAEVNAQRDKDGKQFSGGYRSAKISAVSMMVTYARVEITQLIPSNALYLPGELPSRDKPVPKFMEPKLIDKLRDPQSLSKIQDDAHRAIIQIMMQVGLRVGHTCALPFDCLIDLNRGDSTDKWALSFHDTKSNFQVTVPISPQIALIIKGQKERALLEVVKMGTRGANLLFPNAHASATGQIAPERISRIIKRWIAELDIRDDKGQLEKVTPHRFRHTFATEMIEMGVPIDVVKVLLGHRALSSTERYATTTETRARREWAKTKFVNVHGEILGVAEGAAADAEWMLHRIGRAVQPLPNGACGLPIQKSCPHANACLDNCPHFLTSVEFLPVHEAQQAEFERTISKAEANGHLRIIEINKRPNDNVKKIIKTLRDEQKRATP